MCIVLYAFCFLQHIGEAILFLVYLFYLIHQLNLIMITIMKALRYTQYRIVTVNKILDNFSKLEISYVTL